MNPFANTEPLVLVWLALMAILLISAPVFWLKVKRRKRSAKRDRLLD